MIAIRMKTTITISRDEKLPLLLLVSPAASAILTQLLVVVVVSLTTVMVVVTGTVCACLLAVSFPGYPIVLDGAQLQLVDGADSTLEMRTVVVLMDIDIVHDYEQVTSCKQFLGDPYVTLAALVVAVSLAQ